MRSRYSAYALGRYFPDLADYIIKTTHPKNKHYEKNKAEWKKQILKFSQETQFLKLDVLEFHEDKNFATVTFRAHLMQNYKDASFTEKSAFEKLNNEWLYLSGEIK